MTAFVVGVAESGRSCPYCRFPLKGGATAVRCDVCSAVHHCECWRDNSGCAILGCSGSSRTTAVRDAPPQNTAPSTPERPTTRTFPYIAVAALVLAATAVGGVLVVAVGGQATATPATTIVTTSESVVTTTTERVLTTTVPAPVSAQSPTSPRAVAYRHAFASV